MRSARPAWGTAVAPGATRRPAPNHGAIASAPPVPLPPSNLGLVPPGAAVPQRLTPDSLLALGRTVGNRAVARLVGGAAPAAVQRTLPEGATVRKLDDEDAALSAVGDDVDAYNLLAAGDPRTASEFRPLFAALRKVERALYRWFDAVSRAHTSFAKVPATGPLKVFLKDVDREHAELIDRSKGIEDLVPVDTSSLGAFPGGEPALLTLWQDIVQDRGKIHVRGTDAYRKRVLAELARLLDTDTGRRLLRLLNARQGPEPEGSVEERRTKGWMTDIWIGDRLEDLPEDVRRLSKSLEEPTESKAQPLGAKSKDDFAALMGATEEPVDDTETEETYPTVTGPSELFKVREAAWGGLQGFRFGGKRYRFRGPSTGAFVTSLESDPEESGLASAAGHEILDPSFVTLGHELGHAANMRTGAATASGLDMPDSPTLTAALAGVSVNDARIFWHDPEEVLNIHNVENSLRSDAGLSARGSHAGPDTALRVRRWAQLRAILTATCDPAVDSSWEAVPEFQDIYFRIKDIGGMYGKPKWNDVADDTKFAAYQERVTAFAATWNTTRLVQWKKERVAEARKAMVEAYAATWSASAETEREYKALVARATTQLDAVTALGSRDWDTLVDDLKTFTKKVQGKWFV